MIAVVKRLWIPGFIFSGMLAAIAFGTWRGFPVFDDASLLLFWREAGPGSIAEGNSHRPIVGLLLEFFVSFSKLNPLPHVAINVACWIVIAWQTWRLSFRLFNDRASATIAAILVLSPILVKTHYTTVTTLFPANLAVSLCLAVLLLLLREGVDRKPVSLFVAFFLSAFAASASEYAVAACAASIAILALFNRRPAAAVILAGAIVGYFVFQSIGSFELRPSRATGTQVTMLLQRPTSTLVNFFLALWTSFVGAYGAAAGKIPFQADSRSTILSAFIGIIFAFLAFLWYRQSHEKTTALTSRKNIWMLFVAVAAGLIPVVLANQSPAGSDSYETRFFIPIVPFASIAVVQSLMYITSGRFWPWIAAVLIFIAACTVFNTAFDTVREQIRMEAAGEVLQQRVQESEGMTIAVIPNHEKLDGADITPKVIRSWPTSLVRHVWIMPEWQALPVFGPRTKCRNTKSFDLKPAFLSTGRSGSISQLLFIPSFWNSEKFSSENLEPYCIPLVP